MKSSFNVLKFQSSNLIPWITIIYWLLSIGLIYSVNKPPNYVAQSNEGKLFSDEELANEQFKLNFKLEGADRYTVKKLLADNPECLEGEVLNLLLGMDPFTAKIEQILEDSQEVEKVKNVFKKAIECAQIYLGKIQVEDSNFATQNPEETEVKENYDKFNKINEELYICTNKVLRCYACKQDCERFSVIDANGNLSKEGLQNSKTCYQHCIGSISILPPPPQSQFCERCLDTFFITDRELCKEECDYNPFKKCASVAGALQNCFKTCKSKFSIETQLAELEGCKDKCKTDLMKKYGKIILGGSDKVLFWCFNLPDVFENIGLGKKVDFAQLVGVCILPPDQARKTPGLQPAGPCAAPNAIPQQAGTSGQGTPSQSTSSTSTPPAAGAGGGPTQTSSTPPSSGTK